MRPKYKASNEAELYGEAEPTCDAISTHLVLWTEAFALELFFREGAETHVRWSDPA